MKLKLPRKLMAVLIIASAATFVTGCVDDVHVHGGPGHSVHGGWYYYHYYPALHLYYDRRSHFYYYRGRHGNWHRTRRLPAHYRLNRYRFHPIRMRNHQPYTGYRSHHRKYWRGHPGRGHWKGRGRGHGKGRGRGHWKHRGHGHDRW